MKLCSTNLFFFTVVVALNLTINLQLQLTSAIIGANYGMQADNLPSPINVITLYMHENIPLLRLFEPHSDVLDALRGSIIKVSLGVKNEDVPDIAMNTNTAMQWVNTNIVPFIREVDIGWITVGNEMVPGPNANLIPQAMNNLLSALNSARITNIKISTVVNANVLGVSSPPSAGTFSDEASATMQGIVTWLNGTNNPLLINVYPYIAFASNPTQIPLDYALFNAQQPVIDGEYTYYSLFEAMVDAFYAALEKIGANNLNVVVSETGWPNAGNDPYTSKQNAQTYNQELIDKMKQTGTPRRPNNILDIFIFSMFNEDKKAVGVEQNWGFHYPNMDAVYPLTF
ncbi:hypothetical protein BVRB_1g000420 [Beta vulgaris subsp. vulgaris]|nr:hypothetical protein BVRB_1g000420 [Beta vulgaris subsp. vulgaris]